MSLPRFTAVLLCLTFYGTVLAQTQPTQSAATTPQPAYLSDPHYTAAIHEAKGRAAIGQYAFAIDAYRKADKIAAGIASIPHYFTVDSNGILTSELVGSGYDVEGRLRKLIAKAKEKQPTPTVSIGPGN